MSQNNPKIKREKKMRQTFNVENIILRKKMHESNSGWKVETGMLLSSHVIEIRKQSKHIFFLMRNGKYRLFLVVRLGKKEETLKPRAWFPFPA